MKSTFCFLYSYPWIICPGNESSVVPTQGFPHWWPLTTTRCNYPAAARQSGNYLTIFFSQQGTSEGDLEVIWLNSYSDEEKPLSEKEAVFATSKWEGYFVTFYIL